MVEHAGSRYLYFSDVIIGWGSLPCQGAHHWLGLRDLAYKRAGVIARPASSLSPAQVTILQAAPHEPRQLTGMADKVAQLEQLLPGVQVVLSEMTGLDPKEQLSILANTTVLVSTVGSRGFRLVLLPSGAQTIIIGAPEAKIAGGDGRKRQLSGPFKEVDSCWDMLGYVRVSAPLPDRHPAFSLLL